MALLQHGDKYQVVWNGSEMVITWTDDTGLADETLFNIGVDPEAASGEPSGSILPNKWNTGCFGGCLNGCF